MSRRALQVATVVLSLIPLVTGAVSLLGLADPLYRFAAPGDHVLLDSNLRFFGGLWLGFGIAVLSTVRRIEHEARLYRALWAMIFVGGIGRALGMIFYGVPPAPFIAVTALELVGAPLFVLWQHRVAKQAAR